MTRKKGTRGIFTREQFVHANWTPTAAHDNYFVNLATVFTGGFASFEDWLGSFTGDDERARLRRIWGTLTVTSAFSNPSMGNFLLGILATTELPASASRAGDEYDLETLLENLCGDEFAYEILKQGVVGIDGQLTLDTLSGLSQTVYYNRTFTFDIDLLAKFGGITTDEAQDEPESQSIPFLIVENKDNLAAQVNRLDGCVFLEFDLVETTIRNLLEAH